MNERYQTDEHQGKTRKSASQAKPVTKAASTTSDPLPKTKKQKRQEERERIRKEEEKARKIGMSSSALLSVQYRNWRRAYWVCLVGAAVTAILSFVIAGMGDQYSEMSGTMLIVAYVLIFLALYIDIGKVRKLRRGEVEGGAPRGKSKEARRQQKEYAAKQRERQKEAEARYEAAKAAENEPKPSMGERIKARFGSKKGDTSADAETAEVSGDASKTA